MAALGSQVVNVSGSSHLRSGRSMPVKKKDDVRPRVYVKSVTIMAEGYDFAS